MKRKITGILLAGLLAFSGTGCTQNGETVDNSSVTSSSQSTNVSTSSGSEEEATPEPTATEGAEEESIAVSIPQKDGMQADYMSVDGISLEAGRFYS